MNSHDTSRQEASKSGGASYGQIVTSASLLGGAQVVVYLVSLLRNKVLAVLLGVSGIGSVALYHSILTFIQSSTNFGVATSGVREMAVSGREELETAQFRTAIIINRISWVTGLLGLVLTLVTAAALSRFIFHSEEQMRSIALLGPVVLFTSLAAGRSAVLQGLRRIPELARLQISVAVSGVPIFLILCWWLGLDGVVPAMLALSIVSWLLASVASRGLFVCQTKVTWSETWVGSQQLIRLGVAFMWNLLLSGILAFATRALIVRELDLDANGIFQAAWTLSGMFVGFVLVAMGMDFLPRLTEAANDNRKIVRLVNEQTEIGILLAVPGLLATAAFAPVLIPLLYTSQFVESTTLVPWLIAGCLGQVISWPLGFIQIAKGRSQAYIITQTLFNVGHFFLIYIGLQWFGLAGVSAALPIVYCAYTLGILFYVRVFIEFKWSVAVLRLLATSGALTALVFSAIVLLPTFLSVATGVVATILASAYSIRALVTRLGPTHPLSKPLRPLAGILGIT